MHISVVDFVSVPEEEGHGWCLETIYRNSALGDLDCPSTTLTVSVRLKYSGDAYG